MANTSKKHGNEYLSYVSIRDESGFKYGVGPLTHWGSTIISGGVAQQLMPANPYRTFCIFQNQSVGDLYLNSLSGASGDYNSLKISAGTYYEFPKVPLTAISVYGTTTSQSFYAAEG